MKSIFVTKKTLMQKIIDSKEKKVVAIIICDPADPLSGNKALKYSYIDCTTKGISKFLDFAVKFPTAQYINFYGRKSRAYIDRIYLH